MGLDHADQSGPARSLKNENCIAAALLGTVHSFVGVFGQRLDIGTILRIERDPDAGRNCDHVTFDGKRLADRLTNLFGHRQCIIVVLNIAQKDNKFVAAICAAISDSRSAF